LRPKKHREKKGKPHLLKERQPNVTLAKAQGGGCRHKVREPPIGHLKMSCEKLGRKKKKGETSSFGGTVTKKKNQLGKKGRLELKKKP